jgi:hypothetical protein
MTVDSVIAVPGAFLSKELFYVMATRHRERLSIYMLESDRVSVLAKAGQNMVKLHGSDLTAVGRAGSHWSLGIRERLQASTDRLLALMQSERARFVEVVAGSLRTVSQSAAAVQNVMRSVRDTGVTLSRILKRAETLKCVTDGLFKVPHVQVQSYDVQTARRVESEQLMQSR